MRAFCALLLFAGAVAAADEKTKPLLTEKQLAEGRLLLFDGETTFGWKVTGDVKVVQGSLVLAPDASVEWPFALGPGNVGLKFPDLGTATFKVDVGGSTATVANPKGDTLTGTLLGDGKTAIGKLKISAPKDKSLSLSAIHFRPQGTAPIFNGKDLKGWKKFDDDEKKAVSVFEVTDAKELKVTDGPGDLQTEAKYGDFVLQFECKTNGAGLNGGVFFRCVPKEYQLGYECQIQNAFKDGDRTKPTDSGTGAIYRRIAARKVVADDEAWFTVTLMARGPNLATWVNGYPVVNWVDERPKDDNARKGLRTEAGHLSLQGHDKTTDILFRNLRLAEWK